MPLIERTVETPIFFFGEELMRIPSIVLEPEDRTAFVVHDYMQDYSKQPAIAFCRTIDQCIHVASQFLDAAIIAQPLHSLMSKSARKTVLEEFKSGKIQIITACNLANEGLDTTNAKLAIMLRPIINSLTLYLQQIGRVMRPYKNQEATVLDLIGNIYRHGIASDVNLQEMIY